MVDYTNYPAVMQQHEKGSLSDKYAFIPTTRVIDVMQSRGWEPTRVREAAHIKPENRGFQKHMVRFRQNGAQSILAKDDVFPEIVVTNSHDGLASFLIMAGLFRLVCLNGMVVADAMFSKRSIRHVGYADAQVIEAIDHLSETVPQIASRVHDYDQIELTKNEQDVYARAALLVKYGEDDVKRRHFYPDTLLRPIRSADDKPTLWATYNRVQEKLVNGGKFEILEGGKHTIRSRRVTSVTEDIRINQGLWLLTEYMAKEKGAH